MTSITYSADLTTNTSVLSDRICSKLGLNSRSLGKLLNTGILAPSLIVALGAGIYGYTQRDNIEEIIYGPKVVITQSQDSNLDESEKVSSEPSKPNTTQTLAPLSYKQQPLQVEKEKNKPTPSIANILPPKKPQAPSYNLNPRSNATLENSETKTQAPVNFFIDLNALEKKYLETFDPDCPGDHEINSVKDYVIMKGINLNVSYPATSNQYNSCTDGEFNKLLQAGFEKKKGLEAKIN